MWRNRGLGWIAAIFVLSAAVSSEAQSIAGTVKDATGAVLPGVTVEVSSPALIEKVRSVVTDGSGQYRAIELRTGTYVVTFSLVGFRPVRREGIELTSGFTAAVNAEMRVGDINETITVTGESPLVDVQNVVQQRVMTRDIIDELPTGKVFAHLAVLIPGVIVSGVGGRAQDVGGTVGSANQRLAVHGGNIADMAQLVDGMSVGQMEGGGAVSLAVYSDSNVQEINMGVGANSAEMETGGIRVDIIPKSGGNLFSGTIPYTYVNEHLQSNNLTPELRQRGLNTRTNVSFLSDFNPGFGGPIVRDRLWFYAGYRDWRTDYYSDVYYDSNLTDWVYTPDRSRGPVVNKQKVWNTTGRLTWQMSAKNKLAVNLAHDNRCDCIRVAGTSTIESEFRRTIPTNIVQATWTAPIANRFLLQAGTSATWFPFKFLPQPTAVGPAAVELNGNRSFRAASGPSNGYTEAYSTLYTRHLVAHASASYVPGSHSLKVGVLYEPGHSRVDRESLGDYAVFLLNGVPNRVEYFAMPFSAVTEMRKFAVFAQDQWTVKRLTLNGGIRFDRHWTFYPDVNLPRNNLLPARSFPGSDVLDWRDVSPRLGASYDVFGNGQTAVKVTLSRYVAGETIDLSQETHPAFSAGARLARAWRDDNGDFIPQGDPLNLLANGELIAPSTNVNFGKAVLTRRHDPDWARGWGKRGFNWETSASIQHQLRPRLSVNSGYFRRSYGNFSILNNAAVSASDYDPYCITSPIDSRLPDPGGRQVCGLFDIRAARLGLVDNVRTHAKDFGEQFQRWQGGEVTLDMRFTNGVLLQGGFATGKEIRDNCDIVDKYPQFLGAGVPREYCHQEQPWLNQFKLLGSYGLPWAIRAAATFQSIPGDPLSAGYVVTNASIVPSLGRNLSSGANATVTVNVIRPGAALLDRINQLDLRLSRPFRAGRLSVKGMVDLYNILNSSAVQGVNTSYGTDGSSWNVPQRILEARFLKFGVVVDF